MPFHTPALRMPSPSLAERQSAIAAAHATTVGAKSGGDGGIYMDALYSRKPDCIKCIKGFPPAQVTLMHWS